MEQAAKRLKRLLHDPQYSDLTLTCGRRSWKVHRAVVCGASCYIAEACGKSLTSEPLSVNLGDAVASAVDAVILFLYSGDYDDDNYDDAEYADIELSCPALFNVYVNSLASRLEIADLAALSEAKFSTYLDDSIYTQSFSEAIKETFTDARQSTTTLQKLVLDRCAKHIPEMWAPAARLTTEQMAIFKHLRRTVKEVAPFGDQLLERHRLATAPVCKREADGTFSAEERYRCSDCKQTFVMQSVVLMARREYFCPFCGKKEHWQTWREMFIRP